MISTLFSTFTLTFTLTLLITYTNILPDLTFTLKVVGKFIPFDKGFEGDGLLLQFLKSDRSGVGMALVLPLRTSRNVLCHFHTQTDPRGIQ